LDLGYQKPPNWDQTWPKPDGVGPHWQESMSHRAQFLEFLRDYYRDRFVGATCTVECGPEKLLNQHWLILLTDVAAFSPPQHATFLIQHWNTSITGGLGLGFDCIASTDDFKRAGIGVVERDDHQKRLALRVALAYMTKADHEVKLELPLGAETRMRCQLPRKPAPKPLKRPRDTGE